MEDHGRQGLAGAAAGTLGVAAPLGLGGAALIEPSALPLDLVFMASFVGLPLAAGLFALSRRVVGGMLIGILGSYGLGVTGFFTGHDPASVAFFVITFMGAGLLHTLVGLGWMLDDGTASGDRPNR